MGGFLNWLGSKSQAVQAAKQINMNAEPGETLDQAMARAEGSSKGAQVTLKFNNMLIVYVDGKLRHDMSKLK